MYICSHKLNITLSEKQGVRPVQENLKKEKLKNEIYYECNVDFKKNVYLRS